jgi:16S rRNA (cytosine967-C5)-methyltransferase
VAPDAAALGVEPGWVDAGGGLRLRPDFWPERGGMDGFYAICFEKRES